MSRCVSITTVHIERNLNVCVCEWVRVGQCVLGLRQMLGNRESLSDMCLMLMPIKHTHTHTHPFKHTLIHTDH